MFSGFTRCCYPLQRFDSDPERRFAVIVDAGATVNKWMKPGKAQFQIEYRSGEPYELDFVAETKDRILICEIRAEKELADPVVQAKASAATKSCRSATEHATSNGGKPWAYVLIPDDQIRANASLADLSARFTKTR